MRPGMGKVFKQILDRQARDADEPARGEPAAGAPHLAMQEWVKATGARVCIVFEGRDTAGKGGTIKRITERVSPRVFKVVALAAPTERERSQMYVQRYMAHFPAAARSSSSTAAGTTAPASSG